MMWLFIPNYMFIQSAVMLCERLSNESSQISIIDHNSVLQDIMHLIYYNIYYVIYEYSVLYSILSVNSHHILAEVNSIN